jgi:hypothetical protein
MKTVSVNISSWHQELIESMQTRPAPAGTQGIAGSILELETTGV